MWKDIARALKGESIDWIDLFPYRAVEGNSKKTRHIQKWIAIAKQVSKMVACTCLQVGDLSVLYPPAADLPSMHMTDNEILLGVYVALEQSNTWEEFINSPLLDPLADKELKRRLEPEYVRIMRGSQESTIGLLYAYMPKKFGSLLMWIDVYDHYKIQSGNPWNWLRMAGTSHTPLMAFGEICMNVAMDYVHVLSEVWKSCTESHFSRFRSHGSC